MPPFTSSPRDEPRRPATGAAVTALQWADLYLVRLPLIHEFETSSHRKAHLDHILVRLTDADGVVGWGESACASDPYYSGENVSTCWLMLHDYFIPALLGVDWDTPQQAQETLARISGNFFARAALDIACWDLASRRQGRSVAAALGGTAACAQAGVSLGIEPTADALLVQVARYVDQGYGRVKIKIRPGWDVEPARLVREAFPGIVVQVDANGAYHPAQAGDPVFRQLDALGLAMIEQPFAETELVAHADLQRRLQTPLCLDESVTSLGVARAAVALGACRIINVKVSRMGGLSQALALHDFCQDQGIPLWCGGMHEFGVGRAANVALASLPGFSLPSDVSGSDKYFAEDVVDPPVLATGGQVPVPYQRPGLGHEVIMARVNAHLLRTASLTVAEKGRTGHARAYLR